MTGDFQPGDVRYDAVVVNMEYPWKMPTKDQLQELIDNTIHAWTTINGVNGRKFTNKSDSSKYIFIPAAGAWRDATHKDAGSAGYLWSPGYNSPDSSFKLTSGNGGAAISINFRRYGLPIRPIKY